MSSPRLVEATTWAIKLQRAIAATITSSAEDKVVKLSLNDDQGLQLVGLRCSCGKFWGKFWGNFRWFLYIFSRISMISGEIYSNIDSYSHFVHQESPRVAEVQFHPVVEATLFTPSPSPRSRKLMLGRASGKALAMAFYELEMVRFR